MCRPGRSRARACRSGRTPADSTPAAGRNPSSSSTSISRLILLPALQVTALALACLTILFSPSWQTRNRVTRWFSLSPASLIRQSEMADNAAVLQLHLAHQRTYRLLQRQVVELTRTQTAQQSTHRSRKLPATAVLSADRSGARWRCPAPAAVRSRPGCGSR